MKTNFVKLAGIGFLGAMTLIPLSAWANLIVNGSFENGTFTSGQTVVVLPNGSGAIQGWTVVGGGLNHTGDIAWIQNGNQWNFKASEGSRFLDLTGYSGDSLNPHGGIKLSQSVTTSAGQWYWLSFSVGSSKYYGSSYDPKVTVTVNGTPASFTFTGEASLSDNSGARNHWQTAGFGFYAAGGLANIEFSGTTLGYDNIIHLDNVSLTAVPEPSTVIAGALLLLPFGAGAFRSLRKNRTA